MAIEQAGFRGCLGLVIPVVTAGILSGCAGSAVTTPEQAIAIGRRTCQARWEKEAHKDDVPVHSHPKPWSAQLNGDHWVVSYGQNDGGWETIVEVSQGPVLPASEYYCVMVFID